jgi:hypothetical protein
MCTFVTSQEVTMIYLSLPSSCLFISALLWSGIHPTKDICQFSYWVFSFSNWFVGTLKIYNILGLSPLSVMHCNSFSQTMLSHFFSHKKKLYWGIIDIYLQIFNYISWWILTFLCISVWWNNHHTETLNTGDLAVEITLI